MGPVVHDIEADGRRQPAQEYGFQHTEPNLLRQEEYQVNVDRQKGHDKNNGFAVQSKIASTVLATPLKISGDALPKFCVYRIIGL